MKKQIQDLITTLLSRAMPQVIDLSALTAAKGSRVTYNGVRTPWVRIPNVKAFQVDLGG